MPKNGLKTNLMSSYHNLKLKRLYSNDFHSHAAGLGPLATPHGNIASPDASLGPLARPSRIARPPP